MTTSRLFLDIHAIQTVPPSTLNRDENNMPKMATYGGAQRAVVSSQCWKRHIRLHFAEQVGEHSIGTRTALLTTELAGAIADNGVGEPEASRLAQAVVTSGLDLKTKDDEVRSLKTMLFYSPAQLAALAAVVTDQAPHLRELDDSGLAGALQDQRQRLIEALQVGHTLDIALFGRMVADRVEVKVEGAASVQKAISTHQVDVETDFFTAADDLSPDGGMAHLDTASFTSSTFYRYASLSLPQLRANLSGDPQAAAVGADMFLDSFVKSIPKGKQTSTAPFTVPSVVVAVLREDRGLSLVDAFEAPVRGETSGGYADPSARRLADHAMKVTRMYDDEPAFVGASYMASDATEAQLRAAFGASLPFGRLRDAVREEISERLSGSAA